MSDSRMNVQVSFSADTSQAKKEINGLISQINDLSSKTLKSSVVRNIGEDTKQAAQDVARFSSLLQNAVNINTGKLDLSKFNKSLKEANTSIPKMANSFKTLGSDGVRAFAGIVNQINNAEMPMRKMNAAVDKMWTSLKNTATWTISSSAINALVGGVQAAYSYAQDLDKSLNNIRIVTGYNADRMADFAVEANKAAKALNTTTQNYTDASLIFFQQGLNDAEVAKRTDVVVKMANVTGKATSEIADQLTAVWNNFDDGTKTLEYYADVLTKLGAVTASSTDEIVGGLEKFAAVADTIGLSYEYAASALATITANTRQSEEVVGTALKTIFARIQGLNLGETLDDGTTLNKYSEALQKVGISIFDQAGNLKKMDDILDEMGARWGKLSDSQQVALAQTVAGVRQYNQLISLMDNWNSGSQSMMSNLSVASGAEGELNKQANIYADSWEAAQNRVKASAEKLYDSLIDEEFFKDLADATAEILDFVTNLTKGLGGIEGVLSTVASYFITIARTKISNELIRLTQPSEKKQRAEIQKTRAEANQTLSSMTSAENAPVAMKEMTTTYQNVGRAQDLLNQKADKLTETQRQQLQNEIEQYKVIRSVVEAKAEEVDIANDLVKKEEQYLKLMARHQGTSIQSDFDKMTGNGGILHRQRKAFSDDDLNDVNTMREKVGLGALTEEQSAVLKIDTSQLSGAARDSHLQKYKAVITDIKNEIQGAINNFNTFQKQLDAYKSKSQDIANVTERMFNIDAEGEDAKQQVDEVVKSLEKYKAEIDAGMGEGTFDSLTTKLKKLKAGSDEYLEVAGKLKEALDEVRAASAMDLPTPNGVSTEQMAHYVANVDAAADKTAELEGQQRRAGKTTEEFGKKFENMSVALPSWQEAVVAAAGALTSFVAAGQALAGMWDVINDPEIGTWEKIGTIFSTLATTLGSLAMAFKALNDSMLVEVLTKGMLDAVSKKVNKTTKETIHNKQEENKETLEGNVLKGAEIALDAVDAKVTDEVGDETREAAVARNAENKEIAEGIALKAVDNTMDAMDSKKSPKTPEGRGTTGGVSKWKQLGDAAGKFFKTYGAGLALITAGVAVAVTAISLGVAQWNKYETAAKDAAAAAAKASEAYDTAASAYDDFLSTVSSYEDARASIDELTYGTVEFQEAILRANEEAMKLIDTYEGLEYTVGADGLIIIDEDSLTKAKETQLEILQNAQRTKQLATQTAREAQTQADIVDFQRKHLRSKEDVGMALGNTGAATGSGIVAGALTGAGIGMVAGGGVFSLPAAIAGLVIGGVAGLITGIVGTSAGGSAVSSEDKVLQDLADIYKSEGSAAFASKEALEKLLREKLGIKDEALISSLVNNKDATLDLIQEMAANTAALQAYNASVIQQKFGKDLDATDLSEEAQAAVSMAMGADLEEEKQKLYERKYKDQVGGLTDAEIQKQYAEAMGYTVLKDKFGNKAVYYDNKTGKEIHLSDATARMYLAEQEALKGMNVASHEATKMLQQLSRSSNAAGKGLMQFIEDANFADMTKAEFDAFSKQINANGGALEATEVKDYFTKTLGLTEDQLLTLAESKGFASVEAFITSFIGAFEDYTVDYDKVYNDLVSGAKAIVNGLSEAIKNSLTTAELGQIAKIIEDAYLISGKEGAEFMASMIEAAGAEGSELAGVLDTLDWGTMDVTSLAKVLKDAGIATKFTADELEDMIDVMTHDVPKAAEALAKEFQTLSELEKLKQGDIISQDTYNSIDEKLRSYFTLMADGTYKLTQDAVDFYQAVHNERKAVFKDELIQLDASEKLLGDFSTFNLEKYLPDLDAMGYSEYVRSWYGQLQAAIGGDLGFTLETDESGNVLLDPLTNLPIFKTKDYSARISGHNYETESSSQLKMTQNSPDKINLTVNIPATQWGSGRNAGILYYQPDNNKLRDDTMIPYDTKEYVLQTPEEFQNQQHANIDAATVTDMVDLLINYSDYGKTEEGSQSLQRWKDAAEAGVITYEQLSEIYDVYEENAQQIQEALLANDAELKKQYEAVLMSYMTEASSAQEREEVYQWAIEQGLDNTVRDNAYGLAVTAAINEERREGLDPAEVDAYAKHLQEVIDGLDEEAAEDMAASIMKLNQGFKTLTDNFAEWSSVIKKGQTSTKEYFDALTNLQDAVSDLLGVSEDFLSDKFLSDTTNLDNLEKALDGNLEAYNELRKAAAKDIVINVIANTSGFDEVMESSFDYLNNQAFTIDFSLDSEAKAKWLKDVNDFIEATGMGVEQIEAMFQSWDLTPTFTEYEVPETKQVTTTNVSKPVFAYDETSEQWYMASWDQETTVKQEETGGKIKSIYPGEGQAPQVKSFTVNGSWNNRDTSSGDTGGGGKTSKPAKKPAKSAKIKRYKDIDTSLQNLTDAYEKANKQADKLFGTKKLDNLKKQNELLEDQIGLLKQKLGLGTDDQSVSTVEGYMKSDRGALNSALSAFGRNLKFEYDAETGAILNYDTVMNDLWANVWSNYYDDNDQQRADVSDEALQEFNDLWSHFEDMLSEYEGSVEMKKQIEQMIEDAWDTWRANNYEKLRYELELKVDIQDAELRRVEYYLNKYADDFYKMGESAALMMSQIGPYQNLIGTYQQHVEQLELKVAAGEITQADYIEGLKQARDGLYEQLEALNALDKQMKAYYGETLVAARNELDEATSHLDHNIGLLEHFQNLMELMGKSTDYSLMIDYTKDQASIIKEQIEVSKSWLNVLLAQQKDLQDEMAAAAGDDAAMEILQQKWDDLVLQIEQAQNDILENTKAWLEKMKEAYDLKMNQIANDLEKTLTQAWGFIGSDGQAMWGFDELTKQFNRLSLVQDEFLTKTNQIYETNKLMSQVQQELDKTDNEVSKQKIQNFIKETKGLQDTTKMSQFQLKLQQAKYDLLLAEVALEDARNAKSTVRLKRDSAGNYGYVYTADQDKIAEAEQKVADAENNIYNLSLEAQQEYTQKYMQETQNFFNDLAALNEIREVDEEEYQRRRQALMEQYFGEDGILTNLSYLYNQAVEADTNAAAENWMNQHTNMIGNTAHWRDEVNRYINEIDSAWTNWKENIKLAQEDAQEAIKNTENGTKGLVTESTNLATTIRDTLIPKLKEQIDWVDGVTDAYADQRESILAARDAIEAYLLSLDKIIAQESGVGENGSGRDLTDDYSAKIANAIFKQGYTYNSDYVQQLVSARREKMAGMSEEERKKVLSEEQFANLLQAAHEGDEASLRFIEYVLDDKNNAYFSKASYDTFKALEANKELDFYYLGQVFTGFKTGGYTGSWGPEGRLAILHQKELVLNAADTENLLDTVQIVRGTISDFKKFGSWIPKLITPRTPDVELQPVEKIVQIEASFPGVRDRYEIEEAFNNLINTASQFVNRKKI